MSSPNNHQSSQADKYYKENSMTTRAKFSCTSVRRTNDTWRVTLTPVFSGSEENRKFYAYTPGGSIDLQVVGTDTAGQFQEGHDYYVDFTEVPENDRA